MVQDGKWLLSLVDQLNRIRAIGLGGIFKQFLKEIEEEEEEAVNDQECDNAEPDNESALFFGWRKPVKRYQLNKQHNVT